MKVPHNLRTVHQRSYRMMWHASVGTEEHLTHNCPDITFFEKTNKVVYLIYVGIPKWGNLQTSYINIMRKYAELSI